MAHVEEAEDNRGSQPPPIAVSICAFQVIKLAGWFDGLPRADSDRQYNEHGAPGATTSMALGELSWAFEQAEDPTMLAKSQHEDQLESWHREWQEDRKRREA